MSSIIYALIKVFDKEEYADAFIKNGELFSRRLGDFKGIEDGQVRGDGYEAVTGNYQPEEVSVTISWKDAEGVESSHLIKDLNAPVILQEHGYDDLNLYCMYALKIPDFIESYKTAEEKIKVENKVKQLLRKCLTIDEKVVQFGGFSVVIYRVEEFISKVEAVAKENDLAYWHKLVEYYDPALFNGSFNGLEAAFNKRSCYQFQNEYRFAFKFDEPSGSKKISVGSLEGIACKVPTEDLNKMFKFHLKN